MSFVTIHAGERGRKGQMSVSFNPREGALVISAGLFSKLGNSVDVEFDSEAHCLRLSPTNGSGLKISKRGSGQGVISSHGLFGRFAIGRGLVIIQSLDERGRAVLTAPRKTETASGATA